ncbi:hypothetical protein BH09VER1_BH09VER1_49390 [soil metagenome]
MKFLRGKTLIWVLSVAPVVLISLTVLFPLFARFLAAEARKARCENNVLEIEAGVNGFVSEYGYFPGTNGVLGGDLLATLTGDNSALNPRKLDFLDVGRASEQHSGVAANGVYVDCWGGPYQIAMASGTNQWVVAGTNGQVVQKRVAVWNDPGLGRDGASLSEAQRAGRYVYSWK